MARAFLKSVAEYVHEHHKDKVDKLCIILPNKRGALFLKNYLAQCFGKTIWLPDIISAEEFIARLSGLKTLEEIDLICYLYESYRACYGAEAENFESFARWGQLILQDFNEIDRYLADSEQLYENLKDIKVIENWSLSQEPLSEYQQNYLKFMNSLGAIYKHYSAFLLSHGWAYQGLAYKQAVAQLDASTMANDYHQLLFCGFNALNTAEIKIYQHFYRLKKAEILWDADRYYLDNPNQEAGLFLRNNLKLFSATAPLFIEEHFKTTKNIQLVSVPKQMGQAQVVKQCLQHYIDQNIPLDTVAVVLANEKLLWPVLQQLPDAVEHINITMEYPLRYTSTYAFVEQLIQLQLSFSKQPSQKKTIYHNDLESLLRQPLFLNYLQARSIRLDVDKLIEQIKQRNLSFISPQLLRELFGEAHEALIPLLGHQRAIQNFSQIILDVLAELIGFFGAQQANRQNSLELEYLHIVSKNSKRLHEILNSYPHFNEIQAYRQLFAQVVGSASAPFIGEPLRGLQIMGVLETRTLDFEHLILVNVNEGVLPSGKSINSFIPNDLKRAFGLPLYLEKDAIYAYHFYRLLQRASDITITYDSETDTFGKGEKSRFLTQLQLELPAYHADTILREEVANYRQFPEQHEQVIVIEKNQSIIDTLLKKASSNDTYGGLSPSGLLSYKDCPLKFYFRYGAQLKETQEVEETAEANTFGSILHLSLETFYKPFVSQVLSDTALKERSRETAQLVYESFVSFFDNHPPIGKSILQQDVITVYVKKLVENDIRFVRGLAAENQSLQLLKLEAEFSAPIQVTIAGKETTLFIKGKMDRVDTYAGLVRVIDYKSSVKPNDKFVFSGIENLFLDKNFDKQLQLFLYAWLLYKSNYCAPEKIRACIVPFKEFSEEPKFILDAGKQILSFNADLLNHFENSLRNFIEEIFDEKKVFNQTTVKKSHEYCPYNGICLL